MQLQLKHGMLLIDDDDWKRQFEVELSTKGVFFRGRPCDVEWYSQQKPHTVYAVHTLNSTYQLRLHRLLANARRGTIIDHVNGNGLDNRRSNIRFCTPSGNARNMRIPEGRLRGVAQRKDNGRWEAWIKVNGRKKHLGTFSTQEDAVAARDAAAKSFHGNFAVLNVQTERN